MGGSKKYISYVIFTYLAGNPSIRTGLHIIHIDMQPCYINHSKIIIPSLTQSVCINID